MQREKNVENLPTRDKDLGETELGRACEFSCESGRAVQPLAFPHRGSLGKMGESQKFQNGLEGDRKLMASHFSMSRAIKHDRLFKPDTLAQEQRRPSEVSRKVRLYPGASGGQVTAEGRMPSAPRLSPFALPVTITEQR